MKVTLELDLPAEVAHELPRDGRDLRDLVERGWREWRRREKPEFEEFGELMARFAQGMEPEQVMALKASPRLQRRVRTLLDKNARVLLSREEERELDQHEFVENLVRLAKGQALLKLQARTKA